MSHAILPKALETLRTTLEKIRPDPTNPKLHDSAQIDAITSQQCKKPPGSRIRVESVLG
jgi:hypothetical protein